MTPLNEVFAEAVAVALAFGQFGLALLDEGLVVLRRVGPLSDWLPAEGENACASPFLTNMEDGLAALRSSGEEITFPSMRASSESGARVNVSIRWSAESDRYVVVTTPDHGGEQIERLLATERREKQLLQQQAEAAAAKMRVASALYRDIVESSGYVVLRFGADLKTVFANRQAARFLGAAQEALISRSVDRLFPAIGRDNPWRVDMCADGAASFEIAARDATGELRWLRWDVRFLDMEGGGEFQAIGGDVTQTRRLRAEREKAQEEARAAALAEQRLRIAQDLHDTLVRSIVTLIAQTRLIAKSCPDEAARNSLAELEAQARAGLAETRDAIAQIRSARRDGENLHEILEMFVKRSRNSGCVDIRIEIDPAVETLPDETRELVARVLREALRNVELHSAARGVSVDLRRKGRTVQLDVIDNGVGFDPSAPASGHFGLVGMRERATLAGASLDISSAPGKGTRVTLTANANGQRTQNSNF
jgi:PAS domain S-box-containing protein